jgi:transglutaminase-like putative cysteine protease
MTCERRDFLKGGLALSVVAVMPPCIGKAADTGYAFNPEPGAWRKFEVTTQIDISTPQALAQAWIPLPSITASDWIHPLGDEWKVSDGKAMPLRVGRYGTKMLHVEWSEDSQAPSVRIISRVATRDRSVDLAKPGRPKTLSAAERALFLSPTALIPTDGIVKRSAGQIVAGAKTDEEKALRLYEWVVANTFRDPKTPGCGIGDISSMLRTGNLAGKCADLNALYVGMARSCGIPARDLYGIRVAPSKFGYKSLGANSEVITKAQHCRAEVHLSQWGWVPVDPADVRKVVLEEPPGNLQMNDPKVEAAHKTLFGSWETNWIAYNHGHDISLPGSQRPPINFLMYPQAEVGGERRDCLSADTFKYAITSKEFT